MPVDADFFNNINDAQWSWYQTQIILDEKDQFEMGRDLAEHNAMFWNPEGVRQIRDARDNSFSTPQGDFEEMVEDMFGRKAPRDEKGRPLTTESLKNSNMDPYLNLDLDEVEFTPL